MLVDIRKNGYGLEYGALFIDEQDSYSPWFDDADEQLGSIIASQSVVMSGEPGAGKSHITADVFRAAYSAGMMSCMISCHINTGSMAGREITQDMFNTAKDGGADCLVVIDNLDFTVYTGAVKRRRSDAKVKEYADFLSGAILGCQEAGCTILATVHSDAWRKNHSQATNDVWKQYGNLIEQLKGEQTFTGVITQENAERLLLRRQIDPESAAAIATELARVDALLFRQAHHISPSIFAEAGIEVAVNAVNEIKDQKIAGGK